jgi:competence protein ComEC
MTLFYICISWMAGIALAAPIGLPLSSSLIAGILLALAAYTVRQIRIPVLCAAFFLLGGARLSAAQPEAGPDFIGTYVNTSGEFEIVLEEDPLPRGSGFRARARVERIDLGGGAEFHNLKGAVLAEFQALPESGGIRYGDHLQASGFLKPPPDIEGFDYAGYLARQGVYGVVSDPVIHSVVREGANPVVSTLFAFRRKALAVLRILFPEPESALLAGILLGEESEIPSPLEEAFSRTGTSHIVAISGFNISIIAGIFLSLTQGLPRRVPGWLLAAAGIALYTVLVGAAASVVRSAIMGGMAIFARQMGRRSHGLTSLAFAGAAMTFVNPWTLWDIGFQLSFAATLGLLLYADPLQNGFERLLLRRFSKEHARSAASAAGEIFLMTFAAQITTLPLMLFYFNNLSLSAFLVNPLILSVQPMVMVGGGLALLLGMLWLPAGRALAWAGWAPTAYTIRVVEWGAGLSRLWQPIGAVSPLVIGGYFTVLFALTADSVRRRLPRWEWGKNAAEKIVSAAPPILAAGAFLAWGAYFRLPDGRLHLTMLSGGGEALLLRAPVGGTVLLNGGGDPNLVIAGLGHILGFGPQRLDWIVVGSDAWESTTALADVAARFEIGGVVIPAGTDRTGMTLAAFFARCSADLVPIYEADEGFQMELGGGAILRVLMRSGEGLVLSVESGMARWLILDGLNEEEGRRLLSQGRVPSAQIVLFPFSVKKTGGLADWLREVRPLAGLWPYADDLGWPEGIELLRADAHGWVDLSTDGERMWVKAEK